MANVEDAQIYYEVMGEGKPLILIMGLGGNLEWWGTGFRRQLAKNRQVIALDNRASGRTVTPNGTFTVERMAKDVVGLMDALGLERADVFGISMGGMIAQEMVLGHGDRVGKLLLGCTTCGGKEGIQPTPFAFRLLTEPVESQGAASTNQARLLFPEEYIKKHRPLLEEAAKMTSKYPMSRDRFMHQFTAIQNWRGTFDRLPSLEHETLIMHGTEDILLPPGNADLLYSRLPNAKLIRYEGAGHGYIVQEASKVISDVQSFLD